MPKVFDKITVSFSIIASQNYLTARLYLLKHFLKKKWHVNPKRFAIPGLGIELRRVSIDSGPGYTLFRTVVPNFRAVDRYRSVDQMVPDRPRSIELFSLYLMWCTSLGFVRLSMEVSPY
ncbi:UNVERIFIED_CONTAM: hypothetical protein NCL1_40192 [Trichonephila clavipes]